MKNAMLKERNQKIIEMRKQGISHGEIAKVFNVSKPLIFHVCKSERNDTKNKSREISLIKPKEEIKAYSVLHTAINHNTRPYEEISIDEEIKLNRDEKILIQAIRHCGYGEFEILKEILKLTIVSNKEYKCRITKENIENIENAIKCLFDKEIHLRMRYNGKYE